MSNYILMTDSCADLPEALYQELEIGYVPLTFLIDGQSYENLPDESTMKFSDVYAKLREGANIKTSAINVERFKNTFRPYLEQGKDILYIGFSTGLSGTYSAGHIAAQDLMEEFPERKILTVDSLAASMGQGMLVYHTAKKRLSGASLEETAAYAEETKLHVCHWFTVDDLFFLKRGGRVSAATALLGSALGIKPVLHVDNEGHLINVAKQRGRKNSLHQLVERMAATAINPSEQIPFITHGDCLEDAEYLADLLKERFGVKDVIINYVGPVIGAHSGPGTMALFFLGTER